MDTISKERRSHTMRQVKSRDTYPELYLRRKIHREGFRYRLHNAKLPGKPDLVFPQYRLAVFVNGCFWHGHGCARGNRIPATNTAYWKVKIARNRERDFLKQEILGSQGWRVVVVWECSLDTGARDLLRRLCSLRKKRQAAKE
ncbi:MAG TPA: very short patch repair endonuclease [Candidatus Hydrogenedentes bacterium]|nr:very short patch repair endonuclease [Candidatus Hydrogenedentota bacterium]HOV72929.1 very short patch repair endonuclease [Candidatus Hydrogenedentota bacterium]